MNDPDYGIDVVDIERFNDNTNRTLVSDVTNGLSRDLCTRLPPLPPGFTYDVQVSSELRDSGITLIATATPKFVGRDE